jgi:hypothetical protein
MDFKEVINANFLGLLTVMMGLCQAFGRQPGYSLLPAQAGTAAIPSPSADPCGARRY